MTSFRVFFLVNFEHILHHKIITKLLFHGQTHVKLPRTKIGLLNYKEQTQIFNREPIFSLSTLVEDFNHTKKTNPCCACFWFLHLCYTHWQCLFSLWIIHSATNLECWASVEKDWQKLSKHFGSIMLTFFVYFLYVVCNFLHEYIVSQTYKLCILTVSSVNSFHGTGFFLYPMESSEKQIFCDVFRDQGHQIS